MPGRPEPGRSGRLAAVVSRTKRLPSSSRSVRGPIVPRALITGITGGLLLPRRAPLEKGYEVHGMVRRASTEKFDASNRSATGYPAPGRPADQRSLVDALRASGPTRSTTWPEIQEREEGGLYQASSARQGASPDDRRQPFTRAAGVAKAYGHSSWSTTASPRPARTTAPLQPRIAAPRPRFVTRKITWHAADQAWQARQLKLGNLEPAATGATPRTTSRRCG